MFFSRVQVRPDILQSRQLARLVSENVYGSHQLLWDLFPGATARPFIFREEIAKNQNAIEPSYRGAPVYYLISEIAPRDADSVFETQTKAYDPALREGDRLSFRLRANPVIAKSTDTPRQSGKSNRGQLHDVAMHAQRKLLLALCNEFNVEAENLRKSVLKARILSQETGQLTACLQEVISGHWRYRDLLSQRLRKEALLEWALKSSVDQALQDWLLRKGENHGFELAPEVSGASRSGYCFEANGYQWHALPKKGKNAGFSSVDFSGQLIVRDESGFTNALMNGIGRARAFGCGLVMVKRP